MSAFRVHVANASELQVLHSSVWSSIAHSVTTSKNWFARIREVPYPQALGHLISLIQVLRLGSSAPHRLKVGSWLSLQTTEVCCQADKAAFGAKAMAEHT